MTRGAPCLFVLANTRSLDPRAARRRVTEIVTAVDEASELEGVPYVVISRSDSTLRGHFPAETDAIGAELARRGGEPPDGVILCPAYVEARRLTLGGVHWAASGEEMVPVAATSYAADRTFGYSSSDLAGFVREKSGGEIDGERIVPLPIDVVRGDPDELAGRLAAVEGGQVVLVDALCDADLRAVAIAAIRAEDAGRRSSTAPARPSSAPAPASTSPRRGTRSAVAPRHARGHRSGPTERTGSPRRPGSRPGRGRLGMRRRPRASSSACSPTCRRRRSRCRCPSRWRRRPARRRSPRWPTGPGPRSPPATLVRPMSCTLAAGPDADASLDLARRVSAALVEIVRAGVRRRSRGWVVAKGGITSSDLATEALGIRRAWARGTLLPGIVSLWEPGEVRRPPSLRGLRRERRRRRSARERRVEPPRGGLMLLGGIALLEQAGRDRRAIAGLVAYNLESAQGIVAASERTGAPILLLAGSSAFRHAGRARSRALVPRLARNSDASMGVHLDHCALARRDRGVPRARLHLGDGRRLAPPLRRERRVDPCGRRRARTQPVPGWRRSSRDRGRRGRVEKRRPGR